MKQAGTPSPTLPGYTEIIPFDKATHGKAGIREQNFYFARGLNAIMLHAAEFLQACRHYPIVFVLDANSGSYLPMIVTALHNGQNSFVDGGGNWRKQTYVPAYVRRYPFCSARPAGSSNEMQRIICVDPAGLDFKSRSPLIKKDGTPAQQWLKKQQLVEKTEAEQANTINFTRVLDSHKLLEPFSASTLPKDGQHIALTGMFRINEQQLSNIDPETIKQWISDQTLKLIYFHLMSLDNFRLLLK